MPVLVVLFRRADLTRAVLKAVDSARPNKIYISIDGPRADRLIDIQGVKEVREVVRTFPFNCPVEVRQLENNMGAGGHVRSAVNWLFEHEEQGIILEDDCIPTSAFFAYARHSLERFADSEVMNIAGFSPVPSSIVGTSGIRTSRYPMTWGWATWRRAWEVYTDDLSDWRSKLPFSKLEAIGDGDPWFATYWSRNFDKLSNGSSDVWDYQWVYSTWVHGGKGVFPNVNLVQNRGFGRESTHSFFARKTYALASVESDGYANSRLTLNLASVRAADAFMHRHFYRVGSAYPATSAARSLGRSIVNSTLRN